MDMAAKKSVTARQPVFVALAPDIPALAVERPRRESALPSLHSWLKALRVHQYAKNILVFVPMLTAHAYSLSALLHAGVAFAAFSLCASAVYILNDLIDLDADRQHPTKKQRPFASGALPASQGVTVLLLLLLVAFAVALATSPLLAAFLSVYLLLTTAYSLSLKRLMLADVITLAALYTLRVIAGGAVLSIEISEWLLAFSGFIFVSLALIKRYIELALHSDLALSGPANRNYRPDDLPMIGVLAAASGFNAVTIFALYISSPAVREMYRHPQLLWLICPILLYWLGRMLLLAQRRMIDDDPILFALRDKTSYASCGLMIIIMLLAL